MPPEYLKFRRHFLFSKRGQIFKYFCLIFNSFSLCLRVIWQLTTFPNLPFKPITFIQGD